MFARTLRTSLVLTALFAIVTGLVYPSVVTGIAQAVFPHQANGSLVEKDGHVVGSSLLGQNFNQTQYFHPRPSAAGATGYDPTASGGSNLGPTNPALLQRVNGTLAQLKAQGDLNPDGTAPIDAVTASASGLDPHITLANAFSQVARVAAARHMTPEDVRALIQKHTDERPLGFLGEPGVNVLALNLALDAGEHATASAPTRLGAQTAGILQGIAFVALFVLGSLGMAKLLKRVFERGDEPVRKPANRFESRLFRILGIDPTVDMGWKAYAGALMVFSVVGIAFTFLLLVFQNLLPLNPLHLPGVPWDIALNTAVSFSTNTNWQAYSGESTMSFFSQMVALVFHNFMSAAAGLAVAFALMRGILHRKGAKGLGNFWVDITRITLYVLVPFAIIIALVMVSQGVPQTFTGQVQATTLEGPTQLIDLGPMASQEAIKDFGNNGGGFFNANSAHPFENPNGLTDFLQFLLMLTIPGALLLVFGRSAKDKRQGWVLFGVCLFVFVAAAAATTLAEQSGNPILRGLGADDHASTLQAGGNMEGKETRYGIYSSALFATLTTTTSTGSVNSMHDSYTPLGGMVPLLLIQLGEVVFGGIGAGFVGLLIFVLLCVFLAGLMTGRTPEYLGKKIGGYDVKLVMLYFLVSAICILGFSAVASVLSVGYGTTLNPGPHGLAEMLYAFSSGTGNNGSCFCGLTVNTPFWLHTMTFVMFVARFLPFILVLAIAGSLAPKSHHPPTVGTFPTDGLLFGGLLVGAIVILVALTYFPILVLGPILEHFLMTGGA